MAALKARNQRRALEAFHGHADPKALDSIWPALGSDDRWIRYAARIALESQPVGQWRARALAETNANAGLTALLALARVGGKESQKDLLLALKTWPLDSLTEEQKLLKLRVVEVSFARNGKPDADVSQLAIERLGRYFPAKNWPLNRELSQLLIFLDAPGVVQKTLDLLAQASTQEEQLHYMVALRNAKTGWTSDDRKRYFSWIKNRPATPDGGPTYPRGGNYFLTPNVNHPSDFNQWFADVGLKPGNGASYANFLKNLRKQAAANLSDGERAELAAFITDAPPQTAAPVKEHKFVRDWKVVDIAGDLDKASTGRSFDSGKDAFTAAQCLACHRLGNEGGAVGPDLAGLTSRFTRRDILESLLDPNKVVSEQYQNSTLTKKDGEEITGRVLEENDQRIVVRTDPIKGTTVEVKKSDVTGRAPSKISPMPEGGLNILTRDEILDLIAYIESGGKPGAPAFAK
jgi:putative heme-binding domain-containing protein